MSAVMCGPRVYQTSFVTPTHPVMQAKSELMSSLIDVETEQRMAKLRELQCK